MITNPNSAPPKLAVRILSSLLPEFSRDAILGDLQEDFAQIEMEQGAAAASRWFWRQTLSALPGFALHSLNTTRSRRQFVNGNIWNENWFGKQDSRVAAGIGFVLLLPALLTVGLAMLWFNFGPATVTSIPGASQLMSWMETGYMQIGSFTLPVGMLIMGGLGLALLINLLAVIKINIEHVKDSWRFTFTVKRQPWSLILLALVVLLGFGMDWLIT
jgi:hypothetical protein